jgi:hypothetical protein
MIRLAMLAHLTTRSTVSSHTTIRAAILYLSWRTTQRSLSNYLASGWLTAALLCRVFSQGRTTFGRVSARSHTSHEAMEEPTTKEQTRPARVPCLSPPTDAHEARGWPCQVNGSAPKSLRGMKRTEVAPRHEAHLPTLTMSLGVATTV